MRDRRTAIPVIYGLATALMAGWLVPGPASGQEKKAGPAHSTTTPVPRDGN